VVAVGEIPCRTGWQHGRVTIHDSHPFEQPREERDPVRRFRGRAASGVTLWTSGVGAERAGLTVSSLMVANGEPPRVLALLDPESDLLDALRDSGAAVVHVLAWEHRQLAEMFAGTAPAPGGPFRQAAFEDTAWGPALADAPARAGVRLEEEREVGWSVEVSCTIEDVVLGEDDPPLLHHRGRWRQVQPGR
jgi:flavin reductase (DIM6/NTAB) family NADH-FMN oxidoreductase RutF